MTNIFKFLRRKTAKITICDNVITIEREDGQIAVFEGNKDNCHIEYMAVTLLKKPRKRRS